MTVDYQILSKTISHALRHEPWLYELELDNEGWAPTTQLIDFGAQRWADCQAFSCSSCAGVRSLRLSLPSSGWRKALSQALLIAGCHWRVASEMWFDGLHQLKRTSRLRLQAACKPNDIPRRPAHLTGKMPVAPGARPMAVRDKGMRSIPLLAFVPILGIDEELARCHTRGRRSVDIHLPKFRA